MKQLGNTFTDLTGVNNGTGNVSPSPSDGQVSGAQLFDGSTTKIDVPANPSLDFLLPVTSLLSSGIKVAAAPSANKTVVSRIAGSGSGGLVLMLIPVKLTFYIY